MQRSITSTQLQAIIMLSGVTLSLRNDSISTDGSGHVLITDINPNGDNNEDALICRSERPISGQGVGDWYLHPTEMSIDDGHRIVSTGGRTVPDQGWVRNRDDDEGRRLVRLRRSSDTAVEGVFTCNIPGDTNTPGYLSVYYSSE